MPLLSSIELIAREEGIELGKQEGIELGKQEGIELGKQEGIELGKQEGIELGKQEVAKSMLQAGVPLEQIAQFTGLTLEQIHKIQALLTSQ